MRFQRSNKFSIGDKVTYTDAVKKRHRLEFEIMTVEWVGMDYDFFIEDKAHCDGSAIVVTDISRKQYDYEDDLRIVTPLEELL